MAKAAKPLKPSKAAKQQRKQLESVNPFADSSLFAKSQQYIKDAPDARPFEDMSYIIVGVLGFFIWRLSVAVTSGHEGAIGVWSLFSFGSVVIINVWTFFLVMVSAKRRGDIGILRIVDSDILRFTALSGLFGAWAATLLFRYRPADKTYFPKIIGLTVANIFWVIIYVRYYL
ncbi:hypothetical protein BC939DRAFT_476127 [Gamsiella multidivaricata]|uniref:uncharacterized protein n=1 Tax=Gamsiella multidivaricata TaxID=101098 RepID=UPI00221F916E|nr:uncharacterized protein BC939DRAFT_476127 [Gamsiella multidivaricata]KAG0366010.1 hypothetical protein BGZ54_005945 [Gamsiella multidivaricata]KAI7825688.1 hypothetical protein BC939DRAFT_476127 [Gamsiella multidivaricata]